MSETAVNSELLRLKIDSTDIFLEDFGSGRGKLTISDTYGYNFSYYWGSMSNSLAKFILGLDFGYFNGSVNRYDRGVFDGKRSVTSIRRRLREDFSYELPWYENMEAMKELREKLRELQSCENEHEFMDRCESLADSLDLYHMEHRQEKEFRNKVKDLMCEPWYYIEKGPSEETRFLKQLFPKLKKEIKKELKKK